MPLETEFELVVVLVQRVVATLLRVASLVLFEKVDHVLENDLADVRVADLVLFFLADVETVLLLLPLAVVHDERLKKLPDVLFVETSSVPTPLE